MTLADPLSRRSILTGAVAIAALAPAAGALAAADPFAASPWRKLTDAEWKKRLPPLSYDVLRRAGTEVAGTSPLLNEHRRGTFACQGCGLPLFKSQWKFESGTGWPSFYTAIAGALVKRRDTNLGFERIECRCAQCLGHQGHVFDDGPKPTGLRYCMNGVAMKFLPA